MALYIEGIHGEAAGAKGAKKCLPERYALMAF